MSRFHDRQQWDRTHGPALGAPTDGLSQGTPYTAVIQSVIEEQIVMVTIPALHLSQALAARIQPGTTVSVGDACLVLFDEQKIPWVVVSMREATTAELATRLIALEALGPATAAVAYRSTSLSIPASIFTSIAVDKLPNAASDPHGHMSLSKGVYVVPSTGLYSFTGNVQLEHVAAKAAVILSVMAGGAEIIRGTRIESFEAGEYGLNTSGVFPVTAGEEVSLSVFTTAAGSGLADLGSSANQFSAFRVA